MCVCVCACRVLRPSAVVRGYWFDAEARLSVLYGLSQSSHGPALMVRQKGENPEAHLLLLRVEMKMEAWILREML